MSDHAKGPLKLPIESADLPALDERVAEAICLEHHHSILQFAMAFVGFKWTPEQIGHVAARWPWLWLARAIGWERQKAGKELVPAAFLAALIAQRAEHPQGIKVPPQPPTDNDGPGTGHGPQPELVSPVDGPSDAQPSLPVHH